MTDPTCDDAIDWYRFWSAADAEEYWARADTSPEVRTGLTDAAINPCVYVPKEGSSGIG